VVFSSTRALRGSRRVALVDHHAAAGVAGWPSVHFTAAGCARTVAVPNAINTRKGQHANRKAHGRRACDANTDGDAAAHRDTDPVDTNTNASPNVSANSDSDSNTNADPNTNPNANPNANPNPNPNPNANTRIADLQPCVRDRDGKRGVDQPHWE
jgi:hypothetical protein